MVLCAPILPKHGDDGEPPEAAGDEDAERVDDEQRLHDVDSTERREDAAEGDDRGGEEEAEDEEEEDDFRAWLPEARKLALLSGHRDEITALLLSPDGETLYSGSRDGDVRMWSADGGDSWECVAVLQMHTQAIMALALAPRRGVLFSGALDALTCAWDVGARTLLSHTAFTCHSDAVRCLAVSPDEAWLASGGSDEKAMCVDIDAALKGRPHAAQLVHGFSDTVVALCFVPLRVPDGRDVIWGLVVATSCEGNEIDCPLQLFSPPRVPPVNETEVDRRRWAQHTRIRSGVGEVYTSIRRLAAAGRDVFAATDAGVVLQMRLAAAPRPMWHMVGRNAAGEVQAESFGELPPSRGGGPPLQISHVFAGHTKQVCALALAAGGAVVISGGADAWGVVWKTCTVTHRFCRCCMALRTGQCDNVQGLMGFDEVATIYAVALDDRSGRLFVGTGDALGAIVVYDTGLPQWPWARAVHGTWPRGFRAAARTLLLVLHRLRVRFDAECLDAVLGHLAALCCAPLLPRPQPDDGDDFADDADGDDDGGGGGHHHH